MTTRVARLMPLLLLAALAGCQTALNSGLSERAANDEVALLLRHGVPASRSADPKTGSFIVSVEESRFADAVELLRSHGLPEEGHPTIADVFKGNGLVVSPVEERARMIYALGEELSRTISEIDGVLSARVHIVLPDNDPLQAATPPSSASVFVRYRQGSHVTDLVPQIKMLVANGVAGLDYDKVSLVMVPAVLPQGDASASASMTDVFGLWVYEGSARAVQMLVAACAGLSAAVLALAFWLAWRIRPPVLLRVLSGRLLLR